MKKLFTVMAALGMTATLAACGNKDDQTSTKSDQVSVAKSSSVKKHVKHVESSSTSEMETSSSVVSSSVSSTTKKQGGVSTTASSKAIKPAKATSSSSEQQAVKFTEQDARDMLFAHLGNQANNKQQDASVTATQTNAVAGLSATYLGNNTWKLSGTMNGQAVSYTVSPAGVQ